MSCAYLGQAIRTPPHRTGADVYPEEFHRLAVRGQDPAQEPGPVRLRSFTLEFIFCSQRGTKTIRGGIGLWIWENRRSRFRSGRGEAVITGSEEL